MSADTITFGDVHMQDLSSHRDPTIVDADATIDVLRQSGLVDEGWYWRRYPDVASDALDPVAHYVQHGAAEGRNPNSHFDTKWYINNYRDVAESGMNPLLHYLRDGANEGRATSPAFDTAYYLSTNPDIRLDEINPLLHFLQFGFIEGRKAHPRRFSRIRHE